MPSPGKAGLTDDRPLVVSFWGSLGASHMNAHMEDFFRLEAADGMPFHHIHGVGKSGYPAMTARLRQTAWTMSPGWTSGSISMTWLPSCGRQTW